MKRQKSYQVLIVNPCNRGFTKNTYNNIKSKLKTGVDDFQKSKVVYGFNKIFKNPLSKSKKQLLLSRRRLSNLQSKNCAKINPTPYYSYGIVKIDEEQYLIYTVKGQVIAAIEIELIDEAKNVEEARGKINRFHSGETGERPDKDSIFVIDKEGRIMNTGSTRRKVRRRTTASNPRRKTTKRKTAKRKTAKRKVAKRKTTKRKTTKRKVAKRKTAKRKTAKSNPRRKTAKRKATKRKTAKRKATKRKAVRRKTAKRKVAKRKTAKYNPKRRKRIRHKKAENPRAARRKVRAR